MIQKSLRIGTLNDRSIFKGSSKLTQREFTSFLRSKNLQLDILCLQEVSHYRQQDHLSDNNLRTFSYIFPRSSFVVSTHCAIICLKQGLKLTDAAISLNERCVTATLKDPHNTICKIANVYIPVKKAERHAFLPVLMSKPFWSDLLRSRWFLLGDFNTHLHDPVKARGPRIQPFVGWLNTHFLNCFPKGALTHPRTGSTIDYIFAPRRLATRVLNAQIHHIPPSWTDHSLLSVDLVTSGMQTGPGSWRFNPYLLEKRKFQALLDKTIEFFLAPDYFEEDVGANRASGAGDSTAGSAGLCLRSVQEKWESLKSIVKYSAQQFTKDQKACHKARISNLQRKREQLLGTAEASSKVKKLEQLIEQKIQEDTRQAMLRSATRCVKFEA